MGSAYEPYFEDPSECTNAPMNNRHVKYICVCVHKPLQGPCMCVCAPPCVLACSRTERNEEKALPDRGP